MTGKENATYATSGVDIHQEEDTIKSLTKSMTYKKKDSARR
jgi:hypothetical protein